MKDIKSKAESKMKKSLSSLNEEFGSIRTGRASASLFDKISVDYFGTATPLNQVATISIPEARLVVIQPWDRNIIGEIEKAIQKSELSLNPNNDGKIIRINIPPLTEDRRKELVKMAKISRKKAKLLSEISDAMPMMNLKRNLKAAILPKTRKNRELMISRK